MTEYHYRSGARLKNRPAAQVVGTELETIRQSHDGKLTPRDVVDESAPEDAPLHPVFEWDDAKAADEHRLDQARHVIRAVTVKFRQHENGDPQTVRAFINVQEDESGHYTSSVTVMSDAELRAKTIRKAWNEMVAWKKRYEDLTEFAALFTTIEELDDALPPLLEAAE